MSTGLMVGYLVGWCGEGYWCGGGGEFWGRGRLVESEVVQNILSYFGLPELDLVVDVSGRGEGYKQLESRLDSPKYRRRPVPVNPMSVILVRVCQRDNSVVGFREVEFWSVWCTCQLVIAQLVNPRVKARACEITTLLPEVGVDVVKGFPTLVTRPSGEKGYYRDM